MLNERDHKFATDVLNASLTLMSILVAVITILVVEYGGVKIDPIIAAPLHEAIIGTTIVSVLAGANALIALFQLRLGGNTTFLTWTFGILVLIMTLGIPCVVVFALIA